MSDRRTRVLLVGNGGFFHIGAFFRRALDKLGYEHQFVDEEGYFKNPGDSFMRKVLSRLTRFLTYKRFNQALVKVAISFRPHVLLVVKLAYNHPEVLAEIKSESKTILVNYATDDPFNLTSSNRDVVAGIPYYDLYLSTKRSILSDLMGAGARKAVWLPFGYEPAIHFPERPNSPEETARWASDVVFIGGCDRDRVHFFTPFLNLIDIKLKLYGGHWDRYPELRSFWQGFAVGRDYRLALGGSKVAVGLVRRANRDGNVMRTFEIPACGAFLLAERTDEHLELFEEGKEMVCFSSPEEMVDKIRYYLKHNEERQRITEAGYRRVTTGKHTYHDRLVKILKMTDSFRRIENA